MATLEDIRQEATRLSPWAHVATVGALGIRQPQVSKHLRVLSEAGFVAAEQRHRQRIYRLQPQQFQAVAEWTESFEQLWATRLDALGDLLEHPDPEGTDR